MVDNAQPQIHWQPISALPLVGSMIDGLWDEVEQQYRGRLTKGKILYVKGGVWGVTEQRFTVRSRC